MAELYLEHRISGASGEIRFEGVWTGLIWLRIDTTEGSYKYDSAY
jgi:hypothetical protein